MDFFNDPLQIIFKKHLLDSENRDYDELVEIVIDDYLSFLRYSGAIVPESRKRLLISEIREEIEELVEKIVGPDKNIKRYLRNLDNDKNSIEQIQKSYFNLY